MDDPRDCLDRAARGLLTGTEPVLAAVSGGGDSVALALLARTAFGSRLGIVHVDHGLRDASADDAARVAGLAGELGLPCQVLEAPPTTTDPGATETAARRRRHRALALAARRVGARWVLLAHHADDDLETLLLHLRRGHRGDRILAGIPPVRALDEHVSLVRPLLLGDAPAGRDALTALREDAGLPALDDAMNHDPAIPRVALRQRLAGGDLADLAGAAFRGRWLAARRRARSRLAARLLAAVDDLHRGLRPEGLGCRLDADALARARTDEDLAERLRLLGACLARPRRVDPRGAVLAALRRALAVGRGAVELPADPDGLRLVVRGGGLTVPDERLRPVEPLARLLAAVAAGSLYP